MASRKPKEPTIVYYIVNFYSDGTVANYKGPYAMKRPVTGSQQLISFELTNLINLTKTEK